MAWGVLLFVLVTVIVKPWALHKWQGDGMVQGESVSVIDEQGEVHQYNQTTSTEARMESDGSITTVSTSASDEGIAVQQVTTHTIVTGNTVDTEVDRFIKTFDGFREQLRAFGLAKGVYTVIDGLFGFLHKTTGVPTPDVSGMQ